MPAVKRTPRERSKRSRTNDTTTLARTLGNKLTDELAKDLDAAVAHARWLVSTHESRVTPREHMRARRRLGTLAKEALGVLSMLDGSSVASWQLLTILEERGVSERALEQLKINLSVIKESTKRAQAELGTYTVHAESNGRGELEIVSAAYEKTGRVGRPAESARGVLASTAGLALERHGVHVTKTRDGAFERVLRILFRQAELFEPDDLHRLVIRTVDHVRWVTEHSSRIRSFR
jgi:hypothetical protein